MFNIKKTLTIAAGVAGAFAFGGAHASADTTTAPSDYVVQSGDTLNKLSAKYGVSVDTIATNNNISNVNLIVVGQHLSFATATKAAATTAQSTTTAAATTTTTTTTSSSAKTSTSSASSNSAALNALIARESGGNVNATNGQYYGIGQLSAQARAIYGGNTADYNDQLNAMKAYIAARYGTAENAWAHSQATGWY
ncbi:LysM peptidoglycan-binding domain-containing protein [Leuconostoc falkenbergense]|uniref:LysM peptidoglycan-binding domain-containing protein n=1 Tax=Leuconostoc falkenbergense TaxID=2766470 RepID=UPI001967C5A1|nr:LysM domain-containing protein [Leuconostoc falkenbergense]QSB51825.1 LysM peptidoglycan-binding domain-containing protein [Leuconostoc falkenbergense]